MRALVIDDSNMVRRMLSLILHDLNFDVVEASDGSAGLDEVRAGAQFDVVLVDWHMPNMSGIQFVTLLRAEPALQSTRVLVVSGETKPIERQKAIQAGANDFVVKPFSRASIAEKLAILELI